MAKGFEGSRPDIGHAESRVVLEDRLQWDPTSGNLSGGTASRQYLDVIVDNDFWDVDPEVTRVGAFTQAIQSRIYAGAEVATNDIRRQLYLSRSGYLQRFSDILGIRARDLPLEAYRSKLRDAYLAYQDGGTSTAIARIIGSYTGCPVFITKTHDFPGYWIVGTSYITSNYVITPEEPFATSNATSTSFSPVQIIGASSGTTPGRGILEVIAKGGYAVRARWRMPEDNLWGEYVDIDQSGRYVLTAGAPDNREERVDGHPSELTIECVRPYHIETASSEETLSETIEILPTPDSFRDEQSWIFDSFNGRHGLVVEALGMERLSPSARAEMINALEDVADLPPLGLLEIPLEQPGRMLVGERVYETCWPDEVQTPGSTTSPVMGEGSASLNGLVFSLTRDGESQGAVPQACGPYIVLKERFNRFEDCIPDNFELGPNYTWRIREDLVGQPLKISGSVITELDGPIQTGQGRMFYHADSRTLQFQAPDKDGPEGLDPKGIRADLSWDPSASDLTGVTLVAVSCPTPPGQGRVVYTPALGDTPATLSWMAPEGLQGATAAIVESGRYALASGGSPPLVAGGPARLYVDVVLEDLPVAGVSGLVNVDITSDVSNGGDLTVQSGTAGYRLRIRVFPPLLPDDSAYSTVRFRSAELRTPAIDLTPVGWAPPTSVGEDPSVLLDMSVLDRVYDEGLIRRVYVRQGSSTDETDASWTDWTRIQIFDRIDARQQYVQFRIVVENDSDYFGLPERSQYEFIALALRPSFTVWTEECYFHFDDFYRIVTSGFEVVSPGDVVGTDDLFRDLGLVTGGYDGEMTTIVSPCSVSTIVPAPSGTLVPEATGGPAEVGRVRPTATLVVSPSGGNAELEVEFDASGSFDLDGSIVAWQYDFGDGEITTWMSTPTLSHLYREPGVFSSRVRVRDNDQLLSSWAYQTIVVLSEEGEGSGLAPVANVHASTLVVPASGFITFDLSNSVDYDGFVIGYEYDSGDGQDTGVIASSTYTFIYATLGSYTARFRVLDNTGLYSPWVEVGITVAEGSGHSTGDDPPIAEMITLVTSATGFDVEVDLSNSTDDSLVAQYQVDFGDGVVTPFQSFASFSHTYTTTGTYVVRGRVKDDSGLLSSWDTDVIQVPQYLWPIARLSVTPSSGLVPLAATLDASASTAASSISLYQFDPGDGSIAIEWTESSTLDHTYETPGTYTARVRVQDSAGLISTWDEIEVVAAADVTTPTAVLSVSPTSGDVTLTVTLDGSASVDDVAVTEYQFQGGDGFDSGWTASSSITHDYTTGGTFTARLRVRDADENTSDWVTRTVEVLPVAEMSAEVP